MNVKVQVFKYTEEKLRSGYDFQLSPCTTVASLKKIYVLCETWYNGKKAMYKVHGNKE